MKPKFISIINSKIENFFAPIFKFLYGLGITANILTLSQLPINFFIIYSFYSGNIISAIFLVLLILFIDVIDGPFARITKNITKKGHLYDRLMDITGIVVFLFGIIIYKPNTLLLSSILIIFTIVLYILHEIREGTDIWAGVRPIGLIGLFIGQIEISLMISLIASVATLIVKVFK